MAFLLDGQPLAVDTPFTALVDGEEISFPANWLRLSTAEEKAAIGITEVEDPQQVDQRFYWDVNLPKDHAQLVDQWTLQIKQTAGSLLADTDWYIIRASETGVDAPQSILERRSLIRAMSNDKEAFLSLTTSTEMLAQYVTSPEFNNWESGSSISGASDPLPEPELIK
jgi:hypothetical protein